ncbi:polysaccharide biosynthesis/export family protein [Defluviimonas sp. WL0024]|uniref:Polysaccharide biosynthesis/export family protein n=1 Tax=Albidovulum salinarum TaxID=2984153 RepID=A0ABT2X379_9RHOB|nr:polysaccharide biosynthesis/export family protein [Defluviimonas sp. WL0024]MCU9848378.1 polysaccharide biosynthesis/export family protein [Defluviimonas sp. WL0024]
MTIGHRHFTLASAAGLTLASILWSTGVRADEAYRLLAGDVVAMSIAGVPDLSQEAQVQLDGYLSLPLIGEVRAAGRTMPDLRESIRAVVTSRLVTVYTPNGQEHLRSFARDQVSAWISEYRPVFVSGDVARAGEFRFRPGMTVRQIIAAAGGVALTPAVGPVVNTAGLEADYVGAWHALAAMEARVWRLRTELGEDIGFEPAELPPRPQRNTALEDILRVEKDLREARALDHERERSFLERSLTQIDQQTAVLVRQLEVEKETEVADAADLEQARELSGKGLYTQSRLSDLRSAALISATRRLQTETNLMQLERRKIEVARELERLDDHRHLSLLDEIQQARVKRAAEAAKLNELVARLEAAGLAPPAAGTHGKIVVTVVRASAEESIEAALDLELEPGDVVQVARQSIVEAQQFGAVSAPGTALLRTAADLP